MTIIAYRETSMTTKNRLLELRGPFREEDFDIWEGVDESSPHIEDHVYSCIALYRKNWTTDWPALGGTRWVPSAKDPEEGKKKTKHEARELAMSMYIKNSVLRRAAHSLDRQNRGLFDWQGGKGVIWTPSGGKLTEYRLRCHGQLIDFLRGEYYGSKDAGVATSELSIIARETKYTVGLGCKRDTGEATAHGVHAGLENAVCELNGEFGADPSAPLRGISILVIGAGKVGLPLIERLHAVGAKVYVYDDHLESTSEAVRNWYDSQQKRDAAVSEFHLEALLAIQAAGRVFSKDKELEALRQADVRIISPNGGPTEWLSLEFSEGRSRADILAESGHIRLILGAGNDQVSTTRAGKADRNATLKTLAGAGITFIPDPLVSPGGVIAVSHERSEGEWVSERVNKDAEEIVHRSVEQVFKKARMRGGVDAVTMYEAFEEMIEETWD